MLSSLAEASVMGFFPPISLTRCRSVSTCKTESNLGGYISTTIRNDLRRVSAFARHIMRRLLHRELSEEAFARGSICAVLEIVVQNVMLVMIRCASVTYKHS